MLMKAVKLSQLELKSHLTSELISLNKCGSLLAIPDVKLRIDSTLSNALSANRQVTYPLNATHLTMSVCIAVDLMKLAIALSRHRGTGSAALTAHIHSMRKFEKIASLTIQDLQTVQFQQWKGKIFVKKLSTQKTYKDCTSQTECRYFQYKVTL